MPLFLALLAFHLLAYAGFWVVLSGRVYEFDHASRYGSFQMVYTAYRGAFWVIFTASLPSIIYLSDLKLTTPVIFLFFAGIDALLFNLALTFFYESYLHVRYVLSPQAQSNYGAWKYAGVLALGYGAVGCFVMGAGTLLFALLGW